MSSQPGSVAVVAVAILGALVGLGVDAKMGVSDFKVVTFWSGMMWPILLAGSLATWWAARRAGMRLTLSLAAGAMVGLLPGALRDTRGFSPFELSWPLVMIALVAASLAPVCVIVRRLVMRVAAQQ